MNYNIIPAAITIALIMTMIFWVISKKKIRAVATFFFIVFLVTWAGQLWIRPVGPVAWGVPWITLFAVGLFFSFLIFAIVPPKTVAPKTGESTFKTSGVFYRIIFFMLLTVIAVGHYKMEYPTLTMGAFLLKILGK